jgi:uncharacterized protein
MKPEWRTAVRRVMRKAAAAENGGAARFNYRWEHVKTVVTLADKLADLTGADEEIVTAAAWLHDAKKSDGEAHAQSGARFAAEFLPQTDFPAEKIPAVVQAISEHKGLWRDEPLTNLESMVLWDADKLSKLGLTAVIHFTGMILAGDEAFTTEDLLIDLESAEWQRRAVESMHTEPARRAAKSRMAAYDQFMAELEAELEGGDVAG